MTTIEFHSESLHTSTVAVGRGLMLRGLRTIRRMPSAFFPSVAMPVFTMIAFWRPASVAFARITSDS